MKTEKLLLLSLLTFGCAGIIINTTQMLDSHDTSFNPMPEIIERRIKTDLRFISGSVSSYPSDTIQLSEIAISDKFTN